MKRSIYILFISLFFICSAQAATYYLKQSASGDVGGSNCANAMSVATAMTSLDDNDVGRVCDGETITTIFDPTNDGTSGNEITYMADTQYGATISTAGVGVDLTDRDYWIIKNFYFNDCEDQWIMLSNSTYNTIQDNKFNDAFAYDGIRVNASTYNKIVDNIFEDAPASGDANGTKPSDYIYFNGAVGSPHHNVVEGNTFGKIAHGAIMMLSGQYNVFRENTFQNEYHTGLNLNDPGPHLVEGNFFYDMGSDFQNNPITATANGDRLYNPGIQLNSAANIIRRNVFDNNGSSIGHQQYNADTNADDNRIYHNTMNKAVRVINVYSDYPLTYHIDGNAYKNNVFTNSFDCINALRPAAFCVGYELYGNTEQDGGAANLWLNNNTYGGDGDHYYNDDNVGGGTTGTFAEIISAFGTEFPSGNIYVDPKYTNADARDFTLQSDSQMINAGTYLTLTANSGGGGTKVIAVDDATYFFDGWGITGETADTLYIASSTPITVLIDSISGNNITLTENATWDDSAEVYHCPSGVCFSGSEVDIGAYEYTTVPANAIQGVSIQ